jgi:hypothetical protein
VPLEVPELLDPSSRQLVFETMARVGPSLSISEFFSMVASAYQQAQHSVMPNHDMHKQFKKSDSYNGFLAALRFALDALARPCSILVVGAGAGYAGCSSDYAREVICELGSAHVKNVESLELTPEMTQFPSRIEKTYDLVVSHSLAHFIPLLSSFFAFVSAHVKINGIFVMGHEFNAHFWTDPRIAQLRHRYQRRRRLKKIARNVISPSAYFRWIRSNIGGTVSRSLSDAVNDILRDRHGFKDRLTPSEIAALVDPHLPNGSSYQVGLRGMDADRIQQLYLPDFKLENFNASEFLGLDENEVLRRDLPGRIFNAVYRRSPQR